MKLFGKKPDPLLDTWINIKMAFTSHYGHRARGMMGMLDHLKMQHQGRHHSGIDDTLNIAAVLKRMVADGYRPLYTSGKRRQRLPKGGGGGAGGGRGRRHAGAKSPAKGARGKRRNKRIG